MSGVLQQSAASDRTCRSMINYWCVKIANIHLPNCLVCRQKTERTENGTEKIGHGMSMTSFCNTRKKYLVFCPLTTHTFITYDISYTGQANVPKKSAKYRKPPWGLKVEAIAPSPPPTPMDLALLSHWPSTATGSG